MATDTGTMGKRYVPEALYRAIEGESESGKENENESGKENGKESGKKNGNENESRRYLDQVIFVDSEPTLLPHASVAGDYPCLCCGGVCSFARAETAPHARCHFGSLTAVFRGCGRRISPVARRSFPDAPGELRNRVADGTTAELALRFSR